MWICGGCGQKHEDMDLVQCAACGWSRRFNKDDKRLVPPIRPGVIIVPSRHVTRQYQARRNMPKEKWRRLPPIEEGVSHVVQVHADRSADCASCPASVYAKRCHAAEGKQRRARRRRDQDFEDLGTAFEKVFTIFRQFPETRDDRNLLYDRIEEVFYGITDDWTVGRRRSYFRQRRRARDEQDTWCRRAADIQNMLGLFQPGSEVRAERFAKAENHRVFFASGAPS